VLKQPTTEPGVWRFNGLSDYEQVWLAMRQFTETRDATTPDEIWLVEHPAVFTLGQAGKPEHILNAAHTPVVQSDRGGQVTFHGPGQIVAYVLADLKRSGLTIRAMVTALEQALIDTLCFYGITAFRQAGAPGVYVHQPDDSLAKIAALGIKVRKGCTYHGVALNLDVDLASFERINPCGYPGLRTARMCDFHVDANWDEVALRLSGAIIAHARLRVE
jgi:lipoyl(octanoyl) transferase